ncbi:MAG TPA: Gfo/Idh/MocA family oxidoreductase [Humibacter sp.]|nr:Gfo/Idh/MocA family oxidoreductase [Humibacter sp.]
MTGHATAQRPAGVGFLGAGPVTQAIHLPTLARLGDEFRVETVMDVDAGLAASVADRVGARSTTSMAELLDDDRVEVVVVCSPHVFHAEQVVAACRAGKRAILCEKPFAFDAQQASGIAAVSRQTGVPIVVGAMHTFDAGWLAGFEAWGDRTVTGIRSSIALPPNPRFEDFATELTGRPSGSPPAAAAADAIRGGVLGLAIHDLPLVRQLLPAGARPQVVDARVLQPGGYLIILEAAGVPVELHAVTSHNWRADWVLEAIAPDAVLRVDFTPSYVQAGSAIAQLITAEGARRFGPFEYSGYESEWRSLAGILRGTAAPPELQTLIDDLSFALQIADSAVERVTDARAMTAATDDRGGRR